MATYIRTQLQETIAIQNIITLYYFEFAKDFVFKGEKHDFWEFLYVDKGEVEVVTDTSRHQLKQGSIIFHKPNEFHSFYANHGTAPNLMVMTFDCHSARMKYFEDKIILLQDEERNLLAQIVKEGVNTFTFPFRHPLIRRVPEPTGSEQLIRIYLETFFIYLLRRGETTAPISLPLSSPAKERSEDDLTYAITRYLETHSDSKISLNELSEYLHTAKTRLKDVFKKNKGMSIMEYSALLKIENAKLLIREEASNITEISSKLGFSSVHYFSKAFKKRTGMSPSEYARTIKARTLIESK